MTQSALESNLMAKCLDVDDLVSTGTCFTASYSSKDLILYAISLGFGCSSRKYRNDLPFVFEGHPQFTSVPTFPLALVFLACHTAKKTPIGNSDIPPFPPPLMKLMGLPIPKPFLKPTAGITTDIAQTQLPLIHVCQSLTWNFDSKRKKYHALANPQPGRAQNVLLRNRIVSVMPKHVGTFVTLETTVSQNQQTICSMSSTTLVLGMPVENVVAYQQTNADCEPNGHVLSRPFDLQLFKWPDYVDKKPPTYEATWTIPFQAALLYRLASGDSNEIHIDPDKAPLGGGMREAESEPNNEPDAMHEPRPLLHGLCTLGVVARIILQHTAARPSSGLEYRQALPNVEKSHRLLHIEGRFVKPVFVCDKLRFKFWREPDRNDGTEAFSLAHFYYIVQQNDTMEIVVDRGITVLLVDAATEPEVISEFQNGLQSRL